VGGAEEGGEGGEVRKEVAWKISEGTREHLKRIN
jgi:hypothetical protein